jgi:hypothetical protein
MIEKIVSGGQTGADRMGLDWAIWHDIPHGGWCPKLRKAEDGKIPPQYQLTETPKSDYVQRTEWNVRDSEGTLIFTLIGVEGYQKSAFCWLRKICSTSTDLWSRQ